MEIKNIVDSISCVDFLNKIDNLIFKLLYDTNEGYCCLISKEAIDKSKEYIENFENELQEIIKDNKNDIEDLVKEKKKEFLFKIKQHYFKQANTWADDVYSNLINNCLLAAFVNKKDKYMLDKVYNRGLCGISWLVNIKKYPKEIKDKLFDNFNKKFNLSINSKDENFITENTVKTDYKLFFKLYFMILSNTEEFNSKNFEQYNSGLTSKDIAYFNQLKSKLKTSKASEIKDEAQLLKSAFELMNLQDDKTKYDFLADINNDFKNYFSVNKKLDEETKIAILKRRIGIYKNTPDIYFKNALN